MKKIIIAHAPYTEPAVLEASRSVESRREPYSPSIDADSIYQFIRGLPNATVQELASLMEQHYR